MPAPSEDSLRRPREFASPSRLHPAELTAPTTRLRDSWLEARQEWAAGATMHGSGLGDSDVDTVDGFDAWVRHLLRQADESIPMEPDRVHATYWWIVQDATYLGAISLRHRLNDFLLRAGGHIGYSLRPTARGRGIGAWALAEVLPHARARGLDRVLVTCRDDSLASARTIERNGGVLEDVRETELGRTRRYWIDLRLTDCVTICGMTVPHRSRAAAAVIVAGCLFGTTGTAAGLLGEPAGPDSLGLSRLLVGGALLFLLAYGRSIVGDRRGHARLWTHARDQLDGEDGARRPRGWLVAVGAAAVVGYQPLFFLGVARNGVAVGTVVALGSAPVITGAIDAVRRRARPSGRWAWTTGLAILGVALVSGLLAGGGPADGVGIAASVGAGACYSAYAVAAARLIDRGLGHVRTMGLMFGAAAVIALPWWWATDRAWLLTWRGAAGVLWLGVGATAVAYLLLARGLGALPTPTVATLTLAEPVMATVLGTVVLGERLGVAAAVGICVLGIALAALARGSATDTRLSIAPVRT